MTTTEIIVVVTTILSLWCSVISYFLHYALYKIEIHSECIHKLTLVCQLLHEDLEEVSGNVK